MSSPVTQAPSLTKALSLTFQNSGYCFKLYNWISHVLSLGEPIIGKDLSQHATLFKNAMTVAVIPKVSIDIDGVKEKYKNWNKVGKSWTGALDPFLDLIYAVSELFQSVFSLEKVIFLRGSSFSGTLKKVSVMNDYIQLFKDSVKLFKEKTAELSYKYMIRVAAGVICIGLDTISLAGIVVGAPVKHGLSVLSLTLKISAQVYTNTMDEKGSSS